MSLCRWSTDDFRCDLYVYEAFDGWAIHVAAVRIVGPVVHVDWETFNDSKTSDEMLALIHLQSIALDGVARVPIGLPHDGESWYGLDDEEAAEILTMLQGEGYLFPADIIQEVTQ